MHKSDNPSPPSTAAVIYIFSLTGTVEITILDENDEHPVFKGQYDNIAVKENVKSGVTILQLEATDPDLNDTITFSIE